MSRMMPQGVHSEFQVRMSLTVRAPEGSSPRAALMRKLVDEMTERNETGHLREWMIEALLDRVARDSLKLEPQHSAALADNRIEHERLGLKVPAGLPVVERGTGHPEQAEPVEVQTLADKQQSSPAPMRVGLPKGLRAM